MSENRTVTLFLFVIFTLFLAACSEQPSAVSRQPTVGSEQPSAVVGLPSTSTETVPPPTETAIVPPSETPTTAPTPTDTATPTATPFPELPVGLGTPVPLPVEPLTAQNVNRITELARYGVAKPYATILSGNGQLIFASTSEGVLIYDADTLDRIGVLPIHTNGNVAIPSGDGSQVMINDGNHVLVYDRNAVGRVIWTRPAEAAAPSDIPSKSAISPDGQMVAVGYVILDDYRRNELFSVFRVSDGTEIFTERGGNPVFSPDSRYLAVLWDSKIMIYDTTTWENVTYLSLWQISLNSNYKFSPDGSMMAISTPDRAEVWDIASRRLIRSVDGFEKSQWNAPPRITWSSDSQLIGLNATKNLSVWDIATGNLVGVTGLRSQWDDVIIGPSGDIGIIPSGEVDKSSFPLPEPNSFQWTENGLVWTSHDFDYAKWQYRSSTACLLSASNLDCTTDDTGNLLYIHNNHGDLFMLHDNGSAYVLQNSTGEVVAEIEKLRDHRVQPLYLDDQIFVALQSTRLDAVLYYINREDGSVHTKDLPATLTYWAYSPEASLIATVTSVGGMYSITGLRLSIYDLADRGRMLYQSDPRDYLAPVWRQNVLAYVTGMPPSNVSTIQYLDVASRKTTALDTTNLAPVGFSPDGALLVTQDLLRQYDGSDLVLLDATDGIPVYSWQAHPQSGFAAVFSPDGTMLATISGDGFLKVWGIPPFP